eukprot:517073-Prymnesium_polylepis.2
MTTILYDIAVAEFLEYEFCFEVATFLKVEPKLLVEYKTMYPQKTKEAARYVLMCVCTNQCRMHILDQKTTVVAKSHGPREVERNLSTKKKKNC